jgi:hypothetical protein
LHQVAHPRAAARGIDGETKNALVLRLYLFIDGCWKHDHLRRRKEQLIDCALDPASPATGIGVLSLFN